MNSVRLAAALYHPVLALAALSITVQVLCLLAKIFA